MFDLTAMAMPLHTQIPEIISNQLVRVLLYTSQEGGPIGHDSESVEMRVDMKAAPGYAHCYQKINCWLIPYCCISVSYGREFIDSAMALDRLKLAALIALNSHATDLLKSKSATQDISMLCIDQPQHELQHRNAPHLQYGPIRIVNFDPVRDIW